MAVKSAAQELSVAANILGYKFVPEGAFDSAGNLILPPVQLPSTWTEAAGRVQTSPAWTQIFTTLSALLVPGSWHCWRIGLSFQDGVIRIIVARSTNETGNNPAVGANWSGAFHANVAGHIQKNYAGQRYVLPRALIEPLKQLSDWSKSTDYWEKPPTPGQKDDDKQKQARALQKWRVTNAIDLFVHITTALATITTNGRVLTTFLWYDPSGIMANERVVAWTPLHTLYNAWDLRTLHLIWNSACRDPSGTPGKFVASPMRWSTVVPWRQWGITEVAHDPVQLINTMYPDRGQQYPNPLPGQPAPAPQPREPREPRPPKDWLIEQANEADEVPVEELEAALAQRSSSPGEVDFESLALYGPEPEATDAGDERTMIGEVPLPCVAYSAGAESAAAVPPAIGHGQVVGDRFVFANGTDGPATIWLGPIGRIAVRAEDGSYLVGARTSSTWGPGRASE